MFSPNKVYFHLVQTGQLTEQFYGSLLNIDVVFSEVVGVYLIGFLDVVYLFDRVDVLRTIVALGL